MLVALANLLIIRLFIHGSIINLMLSCLTAYFWMIPGLLFLMCVNVCAEAFTLVVQHFLDVLLPVKKLRVKHCNNPWSSDGAIAAARRRRDWLHHKALRSANPADWSAYRHCRNKVTAMTRSASNNIYHIWHLI